MDGGDIERLVDEMEKRGALGTGDRQIALLRYLVREELEGRGQSVKAFNIAVDVLQRPDTFDPQSNSIVRVEVGRLRRALELYFATDGQSADISIVIPKGSYRPKFVSKRERSEPVAGARGDIQLDAATSAFPSIKQLSAMAAVVALFAAALFVWVWDRTPDVLVPDREANIALNSVEVLPMENRSGDISRDQLALGLTAEIQRRVGNIKTLVTISSIEPSKTRDSTAKHVVSGTIIKSGDQFTFYIALVDSQTRAIVWSEHYPLAPMSNIESIQTITTKIIYDLRGQIFASVRRLIDHDKRRTPSPIELFLLATWFPGFAESSLDWENERIAIARRALGVDPKFGPAHSVLAEKLAYLANVDPMSDTEAHWEEARSHARDALQYAADDPDAAFNIALHFWHAGKLDRSSLAISRVLELHSGHPLANFMARAIPYTCATAPPDTIEQLLRFDQSLESGNPIRWVTLGWLARLHFNRAEYSKALEYGLAANHIFTSPDTVFVVAASYVHLANPGEARRLLSDQKAYWPRMESRHYVETAMTRRCTSAESKDVILAAYRILNSIALDR